MAGLVILDVLLVCHTTIFKEKNQLILLQEFQELKKYYSENKKKQKKCHEITMPIELFNLGTLTSIVGT